MNRNQQDIDLVLNLFCFDFYKCERGGCTEQDERLGGIGGRGGGGERGGGCHKQLGPRYN